MKRYVVIGFDKKGARCFIELRSHSRIEEAIRALHKHGFILTSVEELVQSRLDEECETTITDLTKSYVWLLNELCNGETPPGNGAG